MSQSRERHKCELQYDVRIQYVIDAQYVVISIDAVALCCFKDVVVNFKRGCVM